MAAAVTVFDTHPPLQLLAQYVNKAGKVVGAPANAVFTWTVQDANVPPIESQSPTGAQDLVTLTGSDGTFTVSVADNSTPPFTDSLPVTVTPDQTIAGVRIVLQNP